MSSPKPEARTEEPKAKIFRGVLGLATLVMLLLCWPLWVEPSGFPRVPLAPTLPAPTAAVSWVLFVTLLASIGTAMLGVAWRPALGLSVVLFVVLIFGDQHRFQAWVYQFAMLAVLLAALPETEALRLARWWFIATYTYSGLSKLDVSFCRELGSSMLGTACRLSGWDPRLWPPAARTAAILAMPGWELLVAAGLSMPVTRPLGRVGAVLLHAALVAILGPWGMGHSVIVLIWNVAVAAEVWIAFAPDGVPRPSEPQSERELESQPTRTWVRAARGLAWAAFLVGVFLPVGERWGLCDAWPAHALYASHVERTDVYVLESDLGEYPPEIRDHVRSEGRGPWCRLDLTAWSRAVRGVPVYPQARACNGLAEALAACYGDRRPIRVVQWGRADRWTGARTQAVLLGLVEIQRWGDRYTLNAHPAPGFIQGVWSRQATERRALAVPRPARGP